MKSFYDLAAETFIKPSEYYVLEPGESAFINRELSWMEFNERVLEEARDRENPLFERLNFLSITCSNLDEFFMIRVASLIDLVQSGSEKKDPAGLTPKQQLELLMKRNKKFFKKQYSTYNRQILPQLEKEGIFIVKAEELNADQLQRLEAYFDQTVFPVLSPIAVDAARPFPLISSKSINLLVIPETPIDSFRKLSLSDKPAKKNEAVYPQFAILQIPANLPRLVRVPESSPERTEFILLEDVIRAFLHKLFDNMKILSANCFRIMRNADFEIDEDDTDDFMAEIEVQLKRRKRGEVIRLELEQEASQEVREILTVAFGVPEDQIFKIRGPIDLSLVSKIPGYFQRADLHYSPFKGQRSPLFPPGEDPFACIRRHDILLHHPYESFEPVTEIIRRAAEDPKVLAIKQTLYRVSGNSPIVAALARAAELGKQVLVLVELKARFDEERNIHWARELERAGCHVLYGIKGVKTHSKITLIVREEEDGIKRYVHIGTGNYNDNTAKIYTDIGIWSCSERLGEDATNFFNMISGYSLPHSWNQLIPAPHWLREDTLFRIKREKLNAEKGLRAMIVAKTNSLVDPEIIEALYEASQAGVIVRLIVRGISCLRPGTAKLSENIEVRSIVGRYLEHSRIFYYYNDGAEDLLIGSADWMPRNLDRRIELLTPVRDERCRKRIFEILEYELKDTERARIEEGDGNYHRVDRRGREIIDSQIALCRLAEDAGRSMGELPRLHEHFEPVRSADIDRDIAESKSQDDDL